MRLLLVDDHPLICAGLTLLLEGEPDLTVVGGAASAAEALELDARLSIDLFVIDILLHDGNGVELARDLRARRRAPILGLSVLDQPMRIASMMRAGATSFALKVQPHAELLEAIRATVAGVRYIAPAVREPVSALLEREGDLPFESLTPREREIYYRLVRGERSDRIAEQFAISARTVDTHRHRIMRKLGAHSISDLLLFAARSGELA